MYATELEHVATDLRRLIGRHRGQIWQPRRDTIVLEIGDVRLLIAVGGALPRLHTSPRRPKQPPRPYSFQGACRAHLGGTLTGIDVLAPHRACELHFGRATLHLRFFGRGLGVLLVDGEPVAAMDGPTPDTLPELGTPPGPPRPVRFEPEGDEGWDDAARRWFEAKERASARADLLARVRRRLGREVHRVERLVHALEGDLEAAGKAPELRAKADALAASLHTVRRGQELADLPDLERHGETLRVVLDPRLTPSENLNRMYHKARRLDRAGDRVLERLDEEEIRLARLTEALSTLDEADLDTLRALDEELPRERAPRPGAAKRDWDTWVGPRGMRLKIGRNETANRALCFSVSRGRDWWLHLRDRPGAHVILTLPKEESPPLEALLAGAELAMMAARLPEGAPADVQYTQVRHLRPIPGESGGRVRIAQEKVLRVARDPAQLRGWEREDPL